MHISLTPELEQVIAQKVASGLYNNSSEVIREALRMMWKNDQLEQLRQAVAVGAEQAERGEFVSQSFREIMTEAKQQTSHRSRGSQD